MNVPDEYTPATVWLRAALLAAVTVFLGTAGHVTADGLLPTPAWLAVIFALTIVPAAALLARPASLWRLVVMVVVGQAATHVVLTVTAGHRLVGAVGTLGHSHSSTHAGSPGVRAALESGVHATGSAGGEDLIAHLTGHAPMMAAHMGAAALVGAWLAVGERSLWALMRLLAAGAERMVARAVTALARQPRPAIPPPAVVTTEQPRPINSALARCVVRRGPPLLAI